MQLYNCRECKKISQNLLFMQSVAKLAKSYKCFDSIISDDHPPLVCLLGRCGIRGPHPPGTEPSRQKDIRLWDSVKQCNLSLLFFLWVGAWVSRSPLVWSSQHGGFIGEGFQGHHTGRLRPCLSIHLHRDVRENINLELWGRKDTVTQHVLMLNGTRTTL